MTPEEAKLIAEILGEEPSAEEADVEESAEDEADYDGADACLLQPAEQ